MPRRDPWWQALWILNSGGIEDILGLSTRAELDVNRIWPPREYFRECWPCCSHAAPSACGKDTVTSEQRGGGAPRLQWLSRSAIGDAILAAQRLGLVAALVWLAVWGGKPGRVLVVCILGPLAVFVVARLWTVQSYFVVLYPALFLVLGVVAEKIGKWAWLVLVFAAANIWFTLDLNAYLSRHGGAHGGYGTVIGHKLEAARFLREHADLEGLMAKKQLLQMDQWGKVERARLELPVLASRMEGQGNKDIEAVLVVDMNRADFPPPSQKQISELVGGKSVTATNFGPMFLFLFGR
jgi:hypothetical protein